VRFLQSPSSVGAECQRSTETASAKIRAIKAVQIDRLAAFNLEVSTLKESLETMLNGATPDSGADVKALRLLLRKSFAEAARASDELPVAQSA
jgi:hypothetical protein